MLYNNKTLKEVSAKQLRLHHQWLPQVITTPLATLCIEYINSVTSRLKWNEKFFSSVQSTSVP